MEPKFRSRIPAKSHKKPKTKMIKRLIAARRHPPGEDLWNWWTLKFPIFFILCWFVSSLFNGVF
jgi:hypothetical protein